MRQTSVKRESPQLELFHEPESQPTPVTAAEASDVKNKAEVVEIFDPLMRPAWQIEGRNQPGETAKYAAGEGTPAVEVVHLPSYEPGHPWHYYAEGDGACPVAVSDIPEATYDLDVGKLPREMDKRLQRVELLLEEATSTLEKNTVFYNTLLESGVSVLSNYDREIAYGGNDELAWASTVALKYNHIRGDKLRVRRLGELLHELEVGKLFR